MMKKRGILLVMILVFVIAITGCGTVKGAAKGTIQATKKVCQVPVQGAKKSWQAAKTGAKKSWQAVGAVDNWMQKHLW